MHWSIADRIMVCHIAELFPTFYNRLKDLASKKFSGDFAPRAPFLLSAISFEIISRIYFTFKYLHLLVVSYNFVRRGVPVREGTYPKPSSCDVGSPVLFLTAFISPVLPSDTHLLWINSE